MEAEEILTPRLRLAPFSERDLTPRYVAWLNDPEVVRFSDQRFRSHTVESCRIYWMSFAGTPNRFWTISPRAPGAESIGTMTAYVDANHGVADLGILLGARENWGQGYGREAWTGVCRRLLLEEDLRKVTAGTLEVNQAMVRLAERAGMTQEGRRARQARWEGREVDVLLFGLFREGLA